jgi:hypothetical protein
LDVGFFCRRGTPPNLASPPNLQKKSKPGISRLAALLQSLAD